MTTNYRRTIGKCRVLVCVLTILLVCSLIALIAVAVAQQNGGDGSDPSENGGNIHLDEPNKPPVFHDLTQAEIRGLVRYLYSQKSLNLAHPSKAFVNTSYIYLAEIYIPRKTDVINHLDNNGVQPVREAIVTIFRGDKLEPDIEEIIVGPLPEPSYYKSVPGRRKPIPFSYRPLTVPEYDGILEYINEEVEKIARHILLESFGSSLKDCGEKCVVFRYISPFTPAASGENRRQVWIWLAHFVEFYTLHPLDFSVLVDSDRTTFKITKVWYSGQLFKSLKELVTKYNAGSIKKQKVPFPQNNDDLFSKLTLRHPAVPNSQKKAPHQVEPDGKRYSVKDRHVTYIDWEFDFRMSSAHGPELYNIQFQKERIVYELSMQEIGVYYNGVSPYQKFANYYDTDSMIGTQSRSLVPGADCPLHSTMINTVHLMETSDEPVINENAFCLFELNTGHPLRRKNSNSDFHGKFYEGLENVVLVLRSIVVVVNYDYIIDFVFYANGVIQVKTMSTGYILANAYSPEELPYGFQVHDFITGNLHHHTFNFKADLDIKSRSNRFETLDIEMEHAHNQFSSVQDAIYLQNKVKKNLRRNELDAALQYNFTAPKYLLFYSEKDKNKYGNPKAYRILLKGMSKELIPEGSGLSGNWKRYQLAVTKYKDTERHSSSLFATYGSEDPVVNFQDFLDDNESIVDEDLVAWITMGLHHIPHTEDLPVTTTPGLDLNFYLLPYNYFPECPAMRSHDAIRIAPEVKRSPDYGLKVELRKRDVEFSSNARNNSN